MTLQTNLEELTDAIADECNNLRELINGDQNSLNSLLTVSKSNLVSAINELYSLIDNVSEINDNVITNNSTWSSMKIKEAIDDNLAQIFNGVPSALDTLQELAQAIGNDPNFATTILNSLDKRVRWDVASQNLSISQQNNARINIGAISTTDIGDTGFDYVALFNDGLL